MTSLETVLRNTQNVKVIADSISLNQYIALDLSVLNHNLSKKSLEDSADFEKYIENYLALHDSKVAYGGYNEERNLYQRSTIFRDEETEERNIHIGLDLWIKAGTPILAALDGTLHSFNFNAGFGDYGPTIILEHHVEDQTFYTLYGHLSLDSIEKIAVGTAYKKGQQIGILGDSAVNGDYSPHLHFQIIKNIDANFGDYPGVCTKSDLDFYLDNCPDPNLLLKITSQKRKK
ncbi:peptidase M23 [Flavobacterium sp. ALD4]|jgi:murein DD-endopeptidase MepM/ murein hydrolase activator NlpD|uniref:peptidoglycan DD-metalloendopeptidase family protein n=1 Tax=Flavobacterium sp. ALD4 TaxID=2058314 RepID=UPI000C33A045|nr:peptidoglycan DD-metalloendopeptidase family protein [Flavobacterium sp. ALD4]PKH67944.1 peptidase M23 [Flavobacterium sp. ALD4]